MRTLALSLVVHAAIVAAWVVARPDGEAQHGVSRQAPSIELTAPVEPQAVEVALLPDDTVTADVTSEVVASVAAAPVRAGRRAMTTGAPKTEEVAAPPPEAPEPPTKSKPSLLSMRTSPEIKIKPELTDAQIAAMTDGTMKTKIANLPGAQAKADLDRANGQLRNGRWVDNATGAEIDAARGARMVARQELEANELKEQNDGTYKSDKTTFVAKVDRDGKVHLDDKANLGADKVSIGGHKIPIGLHFDVTDAFMRKYVGDPYAAEKLAYMDRTRDQRVEIGKRYKSEQLAESAKYMLANLNRLWKTTSNVAARKQGVFELWDECAETGDAELVDGAQQARALVERWAQVKLAGGAAYTTGELATLNAHRRSKRVFAPYSGARSATPPTQRE